MKVYLIYIVLLCFVPLAILIFCEISDRRKYNHVCYSAFLLRIAVIVLALIGAIVLLFPDKDNPITRWIGILPLAILLFSFFGGIYTKVVFEETGILLRLFLVTRKYAYEDVEKVEMFFVKDTQYCEKIIIYFSKKKIRLEYLNVNFYEAQSLLIKKLKKMKVPIINLYQKKSQKKKKRTHYKENLLNSQIDANLNSRKMSWFFPNDKVSFFVFLTVLIVPTFIYILLAFFTKNNGMYLMISLHLLLFLICAIFCCEYIFVDEKQIVCYRCFRKISLLYQNIIEVTDIVTPSNKTDGGNKCAWKIKDNKHQEVTIIKSKKRENLIKFIISEVQMARG